MLRPASPFDISTGRDNAFLIGEAAGLISPSSLEGISFAVNSARILAGILNRGYASPHKVYAARILPIRIKIAGKLLKCPFMYRPLLRRAVMASGVGSISVSKTSSAVLEASAQK